MIDVEYKIKVNLRTDDILILVLIYVGLGAVFGLASALLFFVPIFSAILMIVYFLIISLLTIKRILEMISIIPVENSSNSNKMRKDIIKETKTQIKSKSNPENDIKKKDSFDEYEKEFFETTSLSRKEELKELILNSQEFLVKEKDYSSMNEESLEALSQANDIFAIVELYRRKK